MPQFGAYHPIMLQKSGSTSLFSELSELYYIVSDPINYEAIGKNFIV